MTKQQYCYCTAAFKVEGDQRRVFRLDKMASPWRDQIGIDYPNIVYPVSGCYAARQLNRVMFPKSPANIKWTDKKEFGEVELDCQLCTHKFACMIDEQTPVTFEPIRST